MSLFSKFESSWAKYSKIKKTIIWILTIFLSIAMILFLLRPYGELAYNHTHSISKKWFFVVWHKIPNRGQLIIFKNPHQHIYPANSQWVKYLRGIPGDHLEILGDKVLVNGNLIALANTNGPDGHRLTPLSFNGTIPSHQYMALGTSPDSFDSRYAEFGLVGEDQILGTGYPWPLGPE